MKSMLMVGTAIVGAALTLSPIANADDDTFISLLAANGIPAMSGIPALEKTAHDVCDQLNSGVPVDTVVSEWENFANDVTPGLDPGRVHRTAVRFVSAATQAYCPGHQVGYRGKSRVILAGANTPAPAPLPSVPDAQQIIPHPQDVAPRPVPKAPPVVGPPPGAGGGGGGTGGGTRGGCQHDCGGPGIVTLAP